MIHTLVMLHAGPGGLAALRRYEAHVLPVMADHGGRLMCAFRPRADGHDRCPDEVHLLSFPSEDDLSAFRSDPRVTAMAEIREDAIAATTLYVSAEIVDYATRPA